MPSIEDVEKPAEPKKEIIPVKSSEIGIIYPPPEVRSILLYNTLVYNLFV